VNDAMLFADGERFFVMLNRPIEGGANRFGYQPVFTQAIRSVKVNGHMYAFDRSTGKRLWYTDEQFDDQNLSTEQFADLPIIMAANHFFKVAANGAIESQNQKFVAIDKATGRLRYYRVSPNVNQQYYSIVTDPKAGIIEVLNYSGHRIRFVPDDGKSVGMDTTGPTKGSEGPGIGIAIPARPAPAIGVALPLPPPPVIKK